MRPEERTQLEQIALLAAMEEITSGIAHELNQPLSAISLYARGSIRRLESGTSFTEDEFTSTLESISEQAQRAGRIIRQVRDRAKVDSFHREEVGARDILNSMCDEWEAAASVVDVEFQTGYDQDLPKLRVNPTQIRHGIAQILRNALEAATASTPAGQPRRVVIETRGVEGCIQIVCRDSGADSPGDDLEALFQPFVTTKPGHLGLGLGVCRSIFRVHGGEVAATSTPAGTVWTMTLPGPLRKES